MNNLSVNLNRHWTVNITTELKQMSRKGTQIKSLKQGDTITFIYKASQDSEDSEIFLDIKTDDFKHTDEQQKQVKSPTIRLLDGMSVKYTVLKDRPCGLEIIPKIKNDGTTSEGTIIVEDIGDDDDCEQSPA